MTVGQRLRHRVPAIPAPWVATLAVIFACGSMLRGVGLILGPSRTTVSTMVMDALAAPGMWGLGYLGVGAGVVLAYASRIHPFVWAAHVLAFAFYAMVSIVIAQSIHAYGGGFQHVVAPLGGAVWHLLLLYLTKPLPPRGAKGDTTD